MQRALLGEWAGYLEYRDYSEPPTSTKRVQLPSWLTVTQTRTGLSLHYVYDDGPGKVVDETQQLTLDAARGSYTSSLGLATRQRSTVLQASILFAMAEAV